MIQYPLTFPIKIKKAVGTKQPWLSSASLTSPDGDLICAIPPEFEGPGGGFSPEDFYALAVANCFVATFQVIAEKSKVEFHAVNVEGLLTVDRDSEGKPWMKHIRLQVSVEAGQTDHSRIQRVLEKTTQSCLVIHSIKTTVQFEFVIK